MNRFNAQTYNWGPITNALTESVDWLSQSNFPAEFDDDVRSAAEFVDEAEYGLALELICAVLLDAHIPITSRIYDLLAQAGQEMQNNGAILESECWTPLQSLVNIGGDVGT